MAKLKELTRENEKNIIKDLNICSVVFVIISSFTLLLAYIGVKLNLDTVYGFYGYTYLITCFLTLGAFFIIDKDLIFDNKIPRTKMSLKEIGIAFAVMMTGVFVGTMFSAAIDGIFSLFNYTTINNVGNANEISDNIPELIYVAIIGPIWEEVIFRGFLQRKLEKWNPVFAIVTSAICFGIWHGNFNQMISGVFTGLVFGYVAYKYSIKYSMLLHILYNGVFGELFGFITDLLEKNGEEFKIPIINASPFVLAIGVFAIIGAVFIAKYYSKYSKFKIKTNKAVQVDGRYKFTYAKRFKLLVSSIGMWIFTATNIYTAFVLLEKIA